MQKILFFPIKYSWMKITERETVEQIQENPYLQYFIGLDKFSKKIPFDSSMMVHFRQRIDNEIINKIKKYY